jgi:colanic acid biosynthesis protein WcaH
MLDSQTFTKIVAATPLVSIDLIVMRGDREVLLGLRNNRPAQGFWFVPGGRIIKNEPTRTALSRIAEKELGLGAFVLSGELKAIFLGPYEHMYPDCFAGDIGVSTHYVVLAYKIAVPSTFALPKADEQHAELKWWSVQDALASDQVHQYTKNYFSDLG